jgi:hypothetical protein
VDSGEPRVLRTARLAWSRSGRVLTNADFFWAHKGNWVTELPSSFVINSLR